MGLIAVPNVSEGRDLQRIAVLAQEISGAGARVVDTHSDERHNRTVFTVAGDPGVLIAAMTALACAARAIDLTAHSGIHPRVGVLDVCPIVPHDSGMSEAVSVAREIAERIAGECGMPVYLYGEAARREVARELPDIRRGGLEALARRASDDLPPDHGPVQIDPRIGVVCVGARDVLIAFNVWIAATEEVARKIAQRMRNGGRGIRALGLSIEPGISQVSMNLTKPDVAGIDDAFGAVNEIAEGLKVKIVASEIVGVPPQRYMPDPKRKAARLLKRPGRSLESVLA
jgi:glutamate formiminotransferase